MIMASKFTHINVEEMKAYRSWLQYDLVTDKQYKTDMLKYCSHIGCVTQSILTESAVKELQKAFESMFDVHPNVTDAPSSESSSIILATDKNIDLAQYDVSSDVLSKVNDEGYLIKHVNKKDQDHILILGRSDKGILYGTFHFLRLLQNRTSIESLDILDAPRNQLRMINERDNMDGSVERGDRKSVV